MKAKWILAGCAIVTASAVACRCGEEKKGVVSSLPSSAEEIFKLLFADRKKAKVDAPLAAVPNDLDLIAASPDPEAWRAWAVKQPYAKRLMETPLFRELRMSRAYLALDGLQHQAAQAAALTGTNDGRAALWRGPTAAGLRFSEDGPPAVLLVKSIDPTEGDILRFAAAFAMISQEPLPKESRREVSGVELRTLAFRDETILFAVFENLLIAGNDADLVSRAVALAMKDGDDPASKEPLFPPPSTPGIHVVARAPERSALQLFGVDAIGMSLVTDPAGPVIMRRRSHRSATAAALLRYAPEASFLAAASDASPSDAMLAALEDRLGDIAKEKPLASALSPGVAVILGAAAQGESPATPAGLIVFAHTSAPDVLEPQVRQLLADLSGKTPARSVLEPYGGAILLDAGGPSAAITKDALLIGLDPERLRSALAAGTGQAPSLADRHGVDLAGDGGGVYLDLDRAAGFLNGFYAHALEHDAEAPWSEAQEVLGPTFAALGSGGAAFAKMTVKGEIAEGALHAIASP